MSISQWKEEAEVSGYNDKEAREYIIKEQEKAREREKDQYQLELRKLEAEREREKEAHEIKMAELAANNGNGSNSQNNKVVSPKLKLNHFKQGDKIEIFIPRLEEAANLMQYDEVTKRVQFMSLFEGKALEVIHRLDDNSREYKDMKEALLAAYGMSVDDLKYQFSSASINDDETAIQFAARLKGYLDQWLKKDGAEETVEGVKDLILCAQ